MTTTKNNIEEALPKSTRERIYRKLRPKVKSPKKARKEPQMKGRIMPKKTGDNDPRRNNPWVGEALEYLVAVNDGNASYESLDEESRDVLLEFVNHMIAVGMGGWRESEDGYENESGHYARSESWLLNEDGTLSLKKGGKAEFDSDLLHKLRSDLSGIKYE